MFGAYVQVHQMEKPTNNQEARTLGAIALHPYGNAQGSWYFMSLSTGKAIHRYQWTELPIPDEVIKRVHEIAKEEEMPKVEGNFIYEKGPGEELLMDDHPEIDEDVPSEDDILSNDEQGVEHPEGNHADDLGGDDKSANDEENVSEQDESDAHTSDDDVNYQEEEDEYVDDNGDKVIGQKNEEQLEYTEENDDEVEPHDEEVGAGVSLQDENGIGDIDVDGVNLQSRNVD